VDQNDGMLLDIRDLSVVFSQDGNEYVAVKKLNLQLKRGETLGIVGESGSGKSVTALAIMGLLPEGISRIRSGEINFSAENGKSKELLGLSEKNKQQYRGSQISMVFQEPMTSLNPVMRCGKQVAEILVLHEKISKSDAQNRVLHLFEEVKIRDPKSVYQAYPHEISGGQKQRVMLAMAMACKPALLIADEPTTALDVTVQKTILGLFRDLQRTYGMGIIFISHDLSIVSEISEKIAVMKQGEIVEYGTAEQIFSAPQHPYTQGLLACRPPMDKRIRLLPTVDDFLASARQEKNETLATTNNIVSYSERNEHLSALYKQEPVLRIHNIEVRFPERFSILGKTISWKQVVNKISLDVYPGETLGLVGESGCGKTTLGRSILRLVEAASGSIHYKGIDIRQLSGTDIRKFRKNMQIIFQDPYSSLNPRLKVGDCIQEPMQVHGILENESRRKEKVMDLLHRVGLDSSHYFRYPHQFSGGQRQRICIARALALQPEFIICDESVSALDISLQAQVLNLLNELKKDFGFTYIFISHDLSVVKFMSDRIVVMEKGNIVEQGEADALYANPKTAYTQQLIAAIPGN
jgi:peptide/nickel transport system ATP-binding protein